MNTETNPMPTFENYMDSTFKNACGKSWKLSQIWIVILKKEQVNLTVESGHNQQNVKG